MAEQQQRPSIMGGHARRGNRGMPVEKPKELGKTVARLWKYVGRHQFKLILVVIFVISSTLINLRGTSVIGAAIDNYILPGDFVGLRLELLRLAGIYLLSAILSWSQLQLAVNLAQHTVADIRRDLFEKLQVLPLRFFDTTPRGDIMSRITNDVDTVSNALNAGISQLISSLMTIVGILFFMLSLSPRLTLVTVVTVPILLAATCFITKHSRVYFKQQQKVLG